MRCQRYIIFEKKMFSTQFLQKNEVGCKPGRKPGRKSAGRSYERVHDRAQFLRTGARPGLRPGCFQVKNANF